MKEKEIDTAMKAIRECIRSVAKVSERNPLSSRSEMDISIAISSLQQAERRLAAIKERLGA